MRPKVFIVEGQTDAAKLKEVLGQVDIITTNGSEISDQTKALIQALDKTHDIIIFTDPDYAGERIRKEISKDLSHVYHAFLKRDVAISKNKKKIGIEHATKDNIQKALADMQLAYVKNTSDVDHYFLYIQGFIGHKDSKQKRKVLSERLHLGHINGKTLLERIRLFGITKEVMIEVMHEPST